MVNERHTRVKASQIASIMPSDVEATNGPSTNYVPSKNNGTDEFTWIPGTWHTKGQVEFTLYSDAAAETGKKFIFKNQGTVSTIEGGDTTGDDLEIFANSIDTYPSFKLNGLDYVNIAHSTDKAVHLYEEESNYLAFYMDTDAIIESKQTNQNLFLKANGTGEIKTNASVNVDGHIDIKEKFRMVYDSVADSLSFSYIG